MPMVTKKEAATTTRLGSNSLNTLEEFAKQVKGSHEHFVNVPFTSSIFAQAGEQYSLHVTLFVTPKDEHGLSPKLVLGADLT